MARRVFFSFHYDEDLSRMWVVRQSPQFQRIEGNVENTQFFWARDRWETVRRKTDRAIQQWIDDGLKHSGVTVVCIGQYTWQRGWVRYEIEESERQNMGIMGVYIDGIRNWDKRLGTKGPNPFDYADISKRYRTYDWVSDRGYDNFSSWVEQAARDVGR